MNIKKSLIGFLLVFFSSIVFAGVAGNGLNEEEYGLKLSIQEFVQKATKNDKVFEEILIDNLKLAYQKDLGLPARDIVLAVKAQNDFYLGQDKADPEVICSLNKLFPHIGTEVSASYENKPSFTSTNGIGNSELGFLISQPIARNAFGKNTRLKDKIIGVEIDIARYQITEAYEDYLASLIALYYDWYSAYENLKVGNLSYNENLKLLDNIYDRQKQKIALQIDVNKVKLLVIEKKDKLILLQETYDTLTNLIQKAVIPNHQQLDGLVGNVTNKKSPKSLRRPYKCGVSKQARYRHNKKEDLIPQNPSAYHDFDIKFEQDYSKFTQKSRTYDVLRLLKDKTSLEVKENADDLLPSTNLLIGYKVDGEDWDVKSENNLLYAGVSIEFPFGNQIEKAEYEVSKIQHKKTKLSNQNKYLELYTNLKNLYLGIKRQQELIKSSQEKIELAKDILKDETENYSFGKVTLNDYIDAVNRLDANKFQLISNTVQLKKFLVEWLRLTDSLVGELKLLE